MWGRGAPGDTSRSRRKHQHRLPRLHICLQSLNTCLWRWLGWSPFGMILEEKTQPPALPGFQGGAGFGFSRFPGADFGRENSQPQRPPPRTASYAGPAPQLPKGPRKKPAGQWGFTMMLCGVGSVTPRWRKPMCRPRQVPSAAQVSPDANTVSQLPVPAPQGCPP